MTPEALEERAEQDRPDAPKVFDLHISARKVVEEKGHHGPYLISIGERAETIARAFKGG